VAQQHDALAAEAAGEDDDDLAWLEGVARLVGADGLADLRRVSWVSWRGGCLTVLGFRSSSAG
jgi:hypothetical protein